MKGDIGPYEEIACVHGVTGTAEEVSTAIGGVFTCAGEFGGAVVTMAGEGEVGGERVGG